MPGRPTTGDSVQVDVKAPIIRSCRASERKKTLEQPKMNKQRMEAVKKKQ